LLYYTDLNFSKFNKLFKKLKIINLNVFDNYNIKPYLFKTKPKIINHYFYNTDKSYNLNFLKNNINITYKILNKFIKKSNYNFLWNYIKLNDFFLLTTHKTNSIKKINFINNFKNKIYFNIENIFLGIKNKKLFLSPKFLLNFKKNMIEIIDYNSLDENYDLNIFEVKEEQFSDYNLDFEYILTDLDDIDFENEGTSDFFEDSNQWSLLFNKASQSSFYKEKQKNDDEFDTNLLFEHGLIYKNNKKKI